MRSKSNHRQNKFDKKNFLSQIFLFSYLSDELLSKISSLAHIIDLKKDDLLFSEGEKAENLFIVIYGKLSICKISRNGDEQPIHFHKAFDLLAEAAIFDKEVYPAFCKALQDSLIMAIPRVELINIIKKNPDIALKLLASYSKRLREFVSMVEYLTLNDAKERLLRYLIKNAKRDESSSSDGSNNNNNNNSNNKYVVELQISKKELASILGTAAETLSRTLKILKEENIIKTSSSSNLITIVDYHKLKEQF